MRYLCKFNSIEMSKTKNPSFAKQTPYNGQPTLEELYTTDDLSVLKRAITELTTKQDYKTLNTLFRRNPNASKFDSRTLNEDIPQSTKRFTKRNGKLCNVSRTVPRQSTTKPEESDSYTYKSRYYDPHTKSFKYVTRIQSKY